MKKSEKGYRLIWNTYNSWVINTNKVYLRRNDSTISQDPIDWPYFATLPVWFCIAKLKGETTGTFDTDTYVSFPFSSLPAELQCELQKQRKS